MFGCVTNLDRFWPFRNWLTALTNWLAWSSLLCIRLCIISGKISRYCYKHDILKRIYAQNSVVMHKLCIRHGIPYPPTGYIGWHNGAGVTPISTRKIKKAPHRGSLRRGKDGNRLLPTLLPPQTQSYQRFSGFWGGNGKRFSYKLSWCDFSVESFYIHSLLPLSYLWTIRDRKNKKIKKKKEK